MQGTQRYVVFAFLIGGVVLWATVAKLLAAVAFTLDLSDPSLLGSNFTATTLVGLVVAGVAGAVAYRNQQAVGFCNEVAAELTKVTWPQRKEVQTATVVVIVTTLIVALILGLFDVIWSEITGLIYT